MACELSRARYVVHRHKDRRRERQCGSGHSELDLSRRGPPTLPSCRSAVTVEDESRRRGHDLTAERPAANSQARAGVQPFIDDIKRNLRGPSPLGLLVLASTVIEATTERPLDRMRTESSGSQKRPEVFESFVESGLPEAEALAIAIAAIHADELLARRLRDDIEARGSVQRHPPPWLDKIGEIEITDVAEMVHVLDDGDNVYISWRWPNKSAATFLVYIDHNMGTIVKDAFVLPEGFDSLLKKYETIGLEENQVIRPLDPAAARARIVQGVMHGEAVFPPVQNETWPAVRPMLEWILTSVARRWTGLHSAGVDD